MDKNVLPSQLILITENSLVNRHFSKKVIPQIIRYPASNKLIIMIWSAFLCCGDSICQFLEIIFKTCLRNVDFLFIKKMINKLLKTIVQFHFYLYVGKIFERLLYDTLFNYFPRLIYFLQINLYSDQGNLP